MRLNPDCIRDILLTAEKNENMYYPKTYELLSKYETNEVIYHIKQCDMSHLIILTEYSGNEYSINDLTPQGHEFLANIRTNHIWDNTKSLAKDIGCDSLKSLIDISSKIIINLIKTKFGF